MKNYTEIAKVFLPSLIIIAVSFFVVKFGLGKASEINTKIQKEQKTKTTLNQKYKLLSTVSDFIEDDANGVSLALPSSNPVLVSVSQLKTLALNNSVSLADLKAGPEIKDTSGMLRSDIAFEAEGEKNNIFAFVDSISTVAPMMLVDKIKVSEVAGITRADITVKSFWATLPKTLPALTQEINDLTEKEKEILAKVNALVKPQFVTETPVSGDNNRLSPFAL